MQTESIAPVTAEQAWNKVAAMLRARLGNQVFESWFGSMRVEVAHTTDSTVCLSVANTFLVGRVTQQLYFPTLVDIVRLALGKKETAVRVIARPRGSGLSKEDPETVWKRPERDIFGAVPPVYVGQVNHQRTLSAAKVEPRMSRTRVARNVVAKKRLISPAIKSQQVESVDVDLLVQRLFSKYETTTINMVVEMMAGVYGLPQEQIVSRKRDRDSVAPRQMAMYLLDRLTSYSHGQIGNGIGGRDASTVHHGIAKVADDPALNDKAQLYIAAIDRNRP